MKKSFIYSFCLIIIVGSHADSLGMTTQTRRLIKPLPRKTYTPQTVIHTKTSTSPTMTNRFKQYYTQFQQWLWGPRKTEQIIIDKVNEIVENIKKGKFGHAVDDLNYFLKHEKQPEIDIFLNKLVTTKEGLFLLNEYVKFLWESLISPKTSEGQAKKPAAIAEKISIWAKENIINLFLTIPSINKSFFLVPLTLLPNRQLAHAIKDNLTEIQKIPTGKVFLLLLRQQDQELYRTIVFNAVITSNINNIIAKEKSKLVTKE